MIHLNRTLKAAMLAAGLSLVIAPVLMATPVQADEATEIKKDVDQALKRFRTNVKNASTLLERAQGVLVVPEVKKVGLVAGAQWGKGVLYTGDLTKPAAYYRMDAGSLGLQAGYREADFVFLFLTKEALDEFRAEPEWTAKAEADLTVADESWDGSVNSLTRRARIAVFVVDEEGVMGDVSVSGTRFARYTPEKGDK